MITTSVINGKGGVAKSTTALNIAALSATKSKKTLLIDLDPQGTCTYNSGISKLCFDRDMDIEDFSAYRMFAEKLAPSKLALQTSFENLDIIPSSSRLIQLEQEIPAIPNGDTLLTRIFANDKGLEKYDLIIFDSPGYIGHIVHSIVNVTADIIIPNLASASSTRGLIDVFTMVEHMNDFRSAYNLPSVKIRGHFFARAEPATLIHKEQEREIESLFSELGLEADTHKASCNIPKSTQVIQSESAQQPFVTMPEFKDHKVTFQFNRLFKALFQEFAA